MTARKQPNKKFKIEIPESAIRSMMFTGTLAFNMESYDDALLIYKGIHAARPNWSRPLVGMGISLYVLGRVEEAEAAYRKALEIEGNDQEAQLYLGELIWNEREDAEISKKHLQKAFEIDPNNALGDRARFMLTRVQRAKAA